MTRDRILDELSEIARSELERDGLQPEQRLVEDLRLDSIQLLTLATAVEDRFQICLDEDDEASIATVADLVAVIERELARQSVAERSGVHQAPDAEKLARP